MNSSKTIGVFPEVLNVGHLFLKLNWFNNMFFLLIVVISRGMCVL